MRVHLDVVHPPAEPGGHVSRQTGNAARPVRELHERFDVQHGRNGLHTFDHGPDHVFESLWRRPQRRIVHVSQYNAATAPHLF